MQEGKQAIGLVNLVRKHEGRAHFNAQVATKSSPANPTGAATSEQHHTQVHHYATLAKHAQGWHRQDHAMLPSPSSLLLSLTGAGAGVPAAQPKEEETRQERIR